MRSRFWVALVLGFGGLVALIGWLGFGAARRARALHDEMQATHRAYLEAEASWRDVPADLHLAGLYVRDYLLDPSHITAPFYRQKMLELRTSVLKRLDVVEKRMGGNESMMLRQMRAELEAYWESLDPMFDWTPTQKAALSSLWLRRKVLPRRDAVLDLAREIGRFNTADLRREQERLRAGQDAVEAYLGRMTWVALSMGIVVACGSAARVAMLERSGERQRDRIEQAERELRALSRRLVRTQEDERRNLSRELHDAVGQMLTAMGMELRNLETARGHSIEKFTARLEQARQLNIEILRAVRDLAMGLRPSMLDDLGLEPALHWQCREYSRRSGTPVSVSIDGTLEQLPEAHRTCIYRVVQEALTNCGRHARARSIRVLVHGGPDTVHVTVQDDGVGFDAVARNGLGLLSMQERVGELKGRFEVLSQHGKGTVVQVEVPVPAGATA